MPRLWRSALLALTLASGAAMAQTPATVSALKGEIEQAAAISDAGDRTAALDAIWTALRTENRIPFTVGDSAVFLWRGTASGVSVAGDHTGWNASRAPLARVGQGDIWMRAERFTPEARLDYKLVIGSNWILDPNNPNRQWSGFGPNSELRMPDWVFPEETEPAEGLARGALSAPITFQSTVYNASVVYRVYTPASVETFANMPVIYVTDGHEYADDRLGALPIVLDNLVARGEVEPAIVVFIDPRWQGQNRRQDQYVQNPEFAAFVATELVPAIDADYRTRQDRDGRVILGTSLGGVFSAYLGLQHPDVFGKLAIQSPAFWVSESANYWTGPSIYATMQASGDDFQIHMTTGTINDTEDGARRMRTVLENRAVPLTYREVPEGHSWGNWRALLDEMLVTLLPAPGTTDADPSPEASGVMSLRAFPNPAMDFVTFEVSGASQPTRIACSDSLGREVLAVSTAARGELHAVRVPTRALAAGVYVCTAASGEAKTVRTITIAR